VILRISMSVVSVALLAAGTAHAEADASAGGGPPDVELLQTQMLEMQAALKRFRAEHQQQVDALEAQVEGLRKELAELKGAGTAVAGSSGAEAFSAETDAAFPTTDDSVVAGSAGAEASPGSDDDTVFPTTDDSVVAASPAGAGAAPAETEFPTTDASVAPAAEPGPAGWLSGAPITLAGGGRTYLNVSFNSQLVVAGSSSSHLDRLETGDHDPQQRGFNLRNVELALDGAVDPFFEGFANIVFKLDNDNETSVEVEEAYAQTTTLPWGLQLKAGQFFAPFGRINAQHPHTWDFVDSPLVTGRLLGPEGLRGIGAQVAWLAPLPWYSQLMLAVQNGAGEDGYSFRNRGDDDVFYGRPTIHRDLDDVGDAVFAPRLENSFDLSPTQTAVLGVSGAFGPNDTGHGARTEIYGADLYYKWKPANAGGGFPFVKWQTEALLRRFDAKRGENDAFPVSEKFDDWGVYSQLVWGFSKGWTAGLRGDYLHMENSAYTFDLDRQSRWRVSPSLTWYLSEFSKLRLQYNHDFLLSNHFLDSGDADSVFLQFEFNLGAHGAHKF